MVDVVTSLLGPPLAEEFYLSVSIASFVNQIVVPPLCFPCPLAPSALAHFEFHYLFYQFMYGMDDSFREVRMTHAEIQEKYVVVAKELRGSSRLATIFVSSIAAFDI